MQYPSNIARLPFHNLQLQQAIWKAVRWKRHVHH